VIKLEALVGVVLFAIWVFALVDVLLAPEASVRQLPKIGWFIIVLVFNALGALAWFVMGRPEGRGAARGLSTYERQAPAFPEYDRPGRAAAGDAAKDEEFLRQVRERAEAQRKAYEKKRREAEEG
jgi:hypothetical protein